MLGLRGLQFLEGSGGRRNLLGRQHPTPCHEMVGTRWQRRSKSREQLVAEAAAALVPETSAPQGAVNSWGQGITTRAITPEQEGKASGAHSRREERSWASTRKEVKGQERRKGRKEQKSALHTRSRRCTVVFQLEFRWWDMWRACTGKPMPGQNSQTHHAPARQTLGKAVSTDLTRPRIQEEAFPSLSAPGGKCLTFFECLVVARISQHYLRTRRRASNSQHLLFWSSSLEGTMLGWVFFQVSKHSKRSVVARFRRCPCLPKQPLEPRRHTHHSSA